MRDSRTEQFFNTMARTYDRDIADIGWNPVRVLRKWPFVVPAGSSVLDVGCGTGAILEHCSGANRTLAGFDVSPEMVARARKRSALRDTNLLVHSASEPWPVQDDTVDVVIALAMLEFVEHLDRVFDEILRVLRPGGKALASVEDIHDMNGNRRQDYEVRYGELPLWRRTMEDVDMALPPELRLVRSKRMSAYQVVEYGFTAAYNVFELERAK